MNFESIIAMIVPSVAWLLSAALYVVGRYRDSRATILLAGAYAVFGAGMLTLYLSPFGFVASRFLANGLILGSIAAICEALLARRALRLPRLPTAIVLVATLAVMGWAIATGWGLATRIVAVGIGIGIVAGMTAWRLWRFEQRDPVDNIIVAMATLVTVVSFIRPLFFHFVIGDGYGTEEMLFRSVYWVGIVLTAVVGLTAIALTTITAVGLETIHALRVESGTDPLTSLLNRRGFELGAAGLIHAARRQGLPVTVILCDLDHFKSVNDRHGHSSGDQVIASFARCLAAAAPPPHLVGRLGGEEFAIMLRGATGATARLLAEGLRVEFGTVRIEGLPDERFTASFGVAEMLDHDELYGLLSRADRALYDAKGAGRDRVRLAPASVASSALRSIP